MSRGALFVFGGFFCGLVLSLLLLWLRRSRTPDTWHGAVIRVETGARGTNRIRIHYARLDGRTGILTLDPDSYTTLFGHLRPGDRLIKHAGDPMPRRYPSDQDRP